MADFLTNLWTSIFTPGPTPTLIYATNISFFALQSILLALLVATYSIHFIILSFLSAGLWAGINWFVRELEAANQREKQKQTESGRGPKGRVGEGSEGDDEDEAQESGTETEDAGNGTATEETRIGRQRPMVQDTAEVPGLMPQEQDGNMRKRRSFGEASSVGDLSTDSEWDKVEEAGEYKR